MIISLVGYMGSGKSHVAKVLSRKLQLKIIDLDTEISLRNKLTVPEIFTQKGEIFFRKQEKTVLEDILTTETNAILSVGGGAPCFYTNMQSLTQYTQCVFLRTSVNTLSQRLAKQKEKRPLIARITEEDLPEFIAKHLFERNLFYSQAQYTVDTDSKTPEQIADEITKLFVS